MKTKVVSMMKCLCCLMEVLVMSVLVLLLVHVCMLMEQLPSPVLSRVHVLFLLHIGLVMVLRLIFSVL